MQKNSGLAWLVWILVVIGALNWGLVGLGMLTGAVNSWNVVNWLFGQWSWLEAIVYVLVGLAGVLLIFDPRCRTCRTSTKGESSM